MECPSNILSGKCGIERETTQKKTTNKDDNSKKDTCK